MFFWNSLGFSIIQCVVRSFLVFSGFGLESPASGFQFYSSNGVKTNHSSIFAWRIPWREEPGKLWSLCSQRVRCNWSDLAQHNNAIRYVPFCKLRNWHSVVAIKCRRNQRPKQKHHFASTNENTYSYKDYQSILKQCCEYLVSNNVFCIVPEATYRLFSVHKGKIHPYNCSSLNYLTHWQSNVTPLFPPFPFSSQSNSVNLCGCLGYGEHFGNR